MVHLPSPARLLPLLLALLAAGTPCLARADKARRLPIVDRAIAFAGGERYAATETALRIRSKSGAFRLTQRVMGDRFELTVIDTLPDGRERKTRVDNQGVSRWEGGTAVTLDATATKRARDFVMSRVYFPFLPYRLNDASVWKEDLGIEVWEGRKLHKVKIGFDAGSSTDASDEYLYWFEPDTGHLVQYAYSNGGLRFRKLFNERRIGGILFADADNYALTDGAELGVAALTPELVKTRMSKLSTVLLDEIAVTPLPAAKSK